MKSDAPFTQSLNDDEAVKSEESRAKDGFGTLFLSAIKKKNQYL